MGAGVSFANLLVLAILAVAARGLPALFPPLAVSALQPVAEPVPAPSLVAHRPMGTQH